MARFLCYRVGNKRFGGSRKEREKAEEYAKKVGKKVEIWSWRI